MYVYISKYLLNVEFQLYLILQLVPSSFHPLFSLLIVLIFGIYV